MWLLVVMPPRPNDERPDWMYCDSSSPGRTSVMTRLPGSPFRREETSSVVKPRASLPSISRIRSPILSPARSDGVPW